MSVFQHNVNIEGFIKRFPVSTILILINTAFFIITIFTGGFSTLNLLKLGGLNYYAVTFGEYYRLIIAIFLHGSIMHYLFNTFFGIAIIGAGLEKLIGSWKFLIAYLGSGILSSVFVVFISPRNYITVGASGAIYGVLGVFLYIIFYKKHLLSYADRMYIRNLFIINIVFTFISPSISKAGHIGGVLAGFVIGFLLFFRDKRKFYYYYE
ncbi:MAG: gluP [Haloplasmataceae bacterium]|nr:gluP [Haloplasmataceae bacterium]